MIKLFNLRDKQVNQKLPKFCLSTFYLQKMEKYSVNQMKIEYLLLVYNFNDKISG